MIYQWETSGDSPAKVIELYWRTLSDALTEESAQEDRFANSLLYGVSANTATLDELIRTHAANWKIERMSAVDRNILRIAIFEMQQGETAPAVVINEAIELGRRFSGDQSTRFLNGVLDAVKKEVREDPKSPAGS